MTRPRAKHIKVQVTEEERAAIAALAASAGLSLSAYLRTAGLNKKVRSAFDIDAVKELSIINGDFGRISLMLKAYLAESGGTPNPHVVGRIIKELQNLQKMSHDIMGRMTR